MGQYGHAKQGPAYHPPYLSPTCSSVTSHSSHWLVRSSCSQPDNRKKYLPEREQQKVKLGKPICLVHFSPHSETVVANKTTQRTVSPDLIQPPPHIKYQYWPADCTSREEVIATIQLQDRDLWLGQEWDHTLWCKRKLVKNRWKKVLCKLRKTTLHCSGKRGRWVFSTQRFQDKTTNSADKQVFSGDYQLETAKEDYREEAVVLG